jgi:hypothetical protein
LSFIIINNMCAQKNKQIIPSYSVPFIRCNAKRENEVMQILANRQTLSTTNI